MLVWVMVCGNGHMMPLEQCSNQPGQTDPALCSYAVFVHIVVTCPAITVPLDVIVRSDSNV